MKHRQHAFGSWSWLMVVLLASGCSSDGVDGDRGKPGSGGSSHAGTGGSGSGGATGGGDMFSNSDASVASGGSGMTAAAGTGGIGNAADSGPLTAGNACGVGMARAMLKPVNMLVMFDRSQSMEDDDKWPNATAALVSFFENPGAAGLRVALRFFPHDEPAAGCTEDGCDAVACSQPLVPIGELTADAAPSDAQEGALVDAIGNSAPGNRNGGGGGTPIYAALDGALRWATSYRSMHPDETTVVIFVTDGEPNGCDEDFDNISALAADALANSGVTTYAIGLEGSNEAQMDQLANAGGTMQGIYIGNSANAEQELLTALTAIRGMVLSCDFPLPEPTDASMMIDPAKINVTFTPSAGTAGTLRQVPDDASCGTSKAWHYDMPQDPARIVLCPATCDLVRADPDAKLEILLGCATCGGLDVDCGSSSPPDVPPVIPD
jgi:Mg-chelatase subunit ChlD